LELHNRDSLAQDNLQKTHAIALTANANPAYSLMKYSLSNNKGFTLIELLTVVAIVAILGAIIFPTITQFRTLANRTSDSTDLRNIVQASLSFAVQNGDNLVGPTQRILFSGIAPTAADNDLVDVAAILAYTGGPNDSEVWISANESDGTSVATRGTLLTTEGTETGAPRANSGEGGYTPEDFSYGYVVGLNLADPASTPVAFTRMDTGSPFWADEDPYGSRGGHIAFLGGSVNWYDGNLSAKLISAEGQPVNSIEEALDEVGDDVAIRLPIN